MAAERILRARAAHRVRGDKPDLFQDERDVANKINQSAPPKGRRLADKNYREYFAP
jgi:hypothetical protein